MINWENEANKFWGVKEEEGQNSKGYKTIAATWVVKGGNNPKADICHMWAVGLQKRRGTKMINSHMMWKHCLCTP
jgi:hypothetical protein